MKIATWNVNSLRVRLPHVVAWLQTSQVDVLALQEIKLTNEDFPFQAFEDIGYHVTVSGQKTYNGVAIISREEQQNPLKEMPGLSDHQRRVLAINYKNVRIINLYVPNGEHTGSEKYLYKLNWLKHLDLYLHDELRANPNTVVLGDFNIAPDDIDVHDPARWKDKVLFSLPERQAFNEVLQRGFKDCFRTLSPTEKKFTWWDYRLFAFKRNWGLRIDHILASANLFMHCENCLIDDAPRAWERPSDHTPVVAEFVFQ